MAINKPINRIIVSVTNDLVTDQRVNKVCLSLQTYYRQTEIILVGRKLKNSLNIDTRPYKTIRMSLLFEKGFAFYAEYNVRLFFLLLFKKSDLLVSNDLDTLAPNYIISLLKRKKLIYDSHEYFCGVPELTKRPFIQGVWKKIETFILPKLPLMISVSDSITELYQKEYKIECFTIRNLPHTYVIDNRSEIKNKVHLELGINISDKIIIYQGAVNIDRGIEEAILAMKWIENAKLLIVGFGDIYDSLEILIHENKLKNKVILMNRVSFEKLKPYTIASDIGLSLEKDSNLNYRYSLPNKLFDYIAAEIPVLAAPLPEIIKIFNQYQIGELIESHNPEHIANKIKSMLNNKDCQISWKEQLKLAKEEFCWQKEEEKLLEIYKKLTP